MKCVILAAGFAQRMRPLSEDVPKCLLIVGGKPILQRIIEQIREAGCREIGIVVGYKADAVRAFLKERFPAQNFRLIVNPKFESTNNAFSLLMAREFYKGEATHTRPLQKLLLLDGDIVFSPNLLPFLVQKNDEDVVSVRVTGDHDEEEIRVKVDDAKNIRTIGKHISLAETYGESIGIELFSASTAELLFEVLEKRVRAGKGRTEYYEAAFQEMIDSGIRITAVDVSSFPSAEIDTIEDLEFAEKFIASKLLRENG